MPTNAQIRRAGLAFSMHHFRNAGYKINDDPAIRDGFDFIAKKGSRKYYVVVKSSSKLSFPTRWFEAEQITACQSHGDNFLLCLVTNSPAAPALSGIIPGGRLQAFFGNLVPRRFYNLVRAQEEFDL